MATRRIVAEESEGSLLTHMLAGYRTFLENIYSLMRFVESEVTKHGWELVKNGGYGVTRNGAGRHLANFASADWVTTQIGVAFVRQGLAANAQGYTNTEIPENGLELLVFQVRWLDKAPGEPVVWHARLTVEPAGPTKPKKWEEYQTLVFNRLEPEVRADGTRSGRIKPGQASIGGAIRFYGEYGEVPVTALLNQEDVVEQVLKPALES